MKNFFLISVLALIVISCKKNELGGSSTITGTVNHHGKAIKNATVFIKFDAKEFPGKDTNVYDAKIRANENGVYNFNCYKGEYYLYGYGFDYTLTNPLVTGGTPVKVRQNETVEKELAVTED